MNPAKDLLLADVTHAERRRQAEQRWVVYEARQAAPRPSASRWWPLPAWRRGLGRDGASSPDLAATRV